MNTLKNNNDIFKNEITSNITNTDNLINKEKEKEDADLLNLEEDIKNNNPLLYNWEKIKMFKEMRDLQTGLQKEEKEKEIDLKDKKINNLNYIVKKKKSEIKFNNISNNNINITKKSDKSLKLNNHKNNKKNKNKETTQEYQVKNIEEEDDLIMSTIQCPIQACQKKNNKKSFKNNLLINENNENIYNNNFSGYYSLVNNINENKVTNNNYKDENESLLNIFKKEKEIRNKLQKILLNNPSVSQNDFFSNAFDKNKFYNYNSNSQFLSMAKEILINKLTPGEKSYIIELDQEINKVKNHISEIIEEKNNYIKIVSNKKKEFQNFESQKNKIEFEFERDLINDLRSIINKFKREIYKKELEIYKKNNNDEDNTENKEEIEKLKKEYKLKKNDLELYDKNCEKNIIEIQKQIMIKK